MPGVSTPLALIICWIVSAFVLWLVAKPMLKTGKLSLPSAFLTTGLSLLAGSISMWLVIQSNPGEIYYGVIVYLAIVGLCAFAPFYFLLKRNIGHEAGIKSFPLFIVTAVVTFVLFTGALIIISPLYSI